MDATDIAIQARAAGLDKALILFPDAVETALKLLATQRERLGTIDDPAIAPTTQPL